MLDGIIFRLRSGCQWNRLPKEFGDDSTVHRTFQRWVERGVFVGLQQLWNCDDLAGPPRGEPDPLWDRRNAFNVICRLELGVAHVGPPTKRAVTS